MECMILGQPWQAEQLRLAVENADEGWRCVAVRGAQEAYRGVMSGELDVLWLMETPPGLMEALQEQPPLVSPWLVSSCADPLCVDACLEPEQASLLPGMVALMEHTGRVPLLCGGLLPELTRLSAGLLHALDMPPRLGAWAFLPDMLALCTAHPALLQDMGRSLYPLSAARHGLTPACVERRLRMAVESTWNRGSMDALERFFGQSIDPERGKPTNKEFLCQLRLRLALETNRRLARSRQEQPSPP